jgi:methanethiol S-methyltransferase
MDAGSLLTPASNERTPARRLHYAWASLALALGLALGARVRQKQRVCAREIVSSGRFYRLIAKIVASKGETMSRILSLLYGVVCYVVFFGTFLYAIGFVEDSHIHLFGDFFFVPKAIDFGGQVASTGTALVINALLLSLFAVQHSGMARRGFKAFWTRVLVPKAVERSTYVLLASVCLILLFAFWRPMTGVVWAIQNEMIQKLLVAVSLLGWGLVLVATFLINHFELFGLKQVYMHAKGVDPGPAKFKSPGFYKLIRHPIYLGFIIAFWVAPVMTVGHLLFAVATLGYILVAIQLEERDLVQEFGDEYKQYKGRVRGLVPLPKGK